ncbi:ABC transporter ATP-binding protein, partial [bacterium]|nr:ABC transporter ATP-binding protein [bacterium]
MRSLQLPAHKPKIDRIRDVEATFAKGGLDAREEEKLKRGTISDRYLVYMLGRFLKPYRWQLGGVFVLLMIVSGLNLLLPYLVKVVVDGPIANGDADGLVPFGVLYLVAIVLIFALRFVYTYWLQNIGQNALMNLRQEMFEHIIKQDMTYFNHTPVGKLTARFSNDIESLTELLSTSIVMVASNMLTLIGIIIVMFALNWRLALISIITLPFMTLMSAYFRRYLRAVSNRFHRIVGEFQAFLNEYFNGMLIVQLFGRQRQTRDEFLMINTRYFSTHADLRDIYTYYAATLQFMTSLGLAIVLWGGGDGVLGGWVTLGLLIAFIDYTQRAFVPILQLSEQFAQIQTAFSAAERVARLLLVESDIREPAAPTPITHFDKSVAFEDVCFSYEEG